MKKLFKRWKNRPRTRQGWIDLYVSYLKRIPERQYFPIFVLLSLYFVVPYSEFVVTALVPLYFIFEKQVRWVISKIPMPSWLRIGGSVIFFLIMIDDTLFYFGLMAIVYWSAKQVRKEKLIDQHSLTEEG
jgi:D-alanyl-lipoteichoic acid acyltransferase DltB (MBOAT superfamily)